MFLSNYPEEKSDVVALLKSDFRDFKLSIINGDVNIKVGPNRSINEKMDFITDTFPDDIVTGSTALHLYGLLDRTPADIDIIINDKNRYIGYQKDTYGDEDSLTNRLGFIVMKYKKNIFSSTVEYQVDFFENNNTNYREYSVAEHRYLYGKLIKIQDPIEIISHKMNMAAKGNRKHLNDLYSIFNNFKTYRTKYGF